MGSNGDYSLRWNDYEPTIARAFRDLREDNDFLDVTLACEDEQIEAHKVILSACSPFFRNILKRNPHQHPLIYLKGMKFNELQPIINFMYNGEANVANEDLNSFLAASAELKIKGLAQVDEMPWNNMESEEASAQKLNETDEGKDPLDPVHKKKRQRSGQVKIPQSSHSSPKTEDSKIPDDSEMYEDDPFKIEFKSESQNFIEINEEENSLERFLMDRNSFDLKNEMINSEGGEQMESRVIRKKAKTAHSCSYCDYKSTKKSNIKCHEMAKHQGIYYSCDLCDFTSSWKQKLNLHMRTKHV